MIALPFAGAQANFRVLMNQYDEDLKFTTVDDNVANRGLERPDEESNETLEADQFVVTLDYEQQIRQVSVSDFPAIFRSW